MRLRLKVLGRVQISDDVSIVVRRASWATGIRWIDIRESKKIVPGGDVWGSEGLIVPEGMLNDFTKLVAMVSKKVGGTHGRRSPRAEAKISVRERIKHNYGCEPEILGMFECTKDNYVVAALCSIKSAGVRGGRYVDIRGFYGGRAIDDWPKEGIAIPLGVWPEIYKIMQPLFGIEAVIIANNDLGS